MANDRTSKHTAPGLDEPSGVEPPAHAGDGHVEGARPHTFEEDDRGEGSVGGVAETRTEEPKKQEPEMETSDQEEPLPESEKTPFKFDPLAPYKGAFRRFFTVYRHTLGLLAGGNLAYVRALPAGERTGFNHLVARTTAFLVKPFVKKELRHLSFAKQLRRRLEILGPTFIKLGQIMAIREDLLPHEITSELENLLDRLPEVPFPQVKAIIERDLEAPTEELFDYIEEEPLGSASIAQVHRAETRSGVQVVLKVIKPGIREVITSDLKLLEAVGALLQRAFPRYQPKQIIEEFSAYTEKEVDYSFEADNAEIFAANFKDAPGIVFPRIYRELSSRDVLTMEYLQGLKPGSKAARELSGAERNRVIDLGAEGIIRMLYLDGFFHADLHAGNLVILPGDPIRVGFIDLGMVGRFGTKVKRRLLYYFYSLVRGDVENATRYLLEIARVGEGGDPQGFQRAVADLSRRFQMHGGRELSIAQLILESLSLGGKYRIFFPVELTLMVKALITYEGVGRTMDPDLDVAEVSKKHITSIFQKRFDPRTLGREMISNAPEMVDLAVELPQLVSMGAKFFEEKITTPNNESDAFSGLRSGILAGSCIVGGVLALGMGTPWYLWAGLFGLGFWLAVTGK